MRRRTTLSEVAESAGVSVQTVSNVVNNKPIVRDETRELVLKHLAECGYRSNAMARSLKTNKSRLIGLVVPSMTNSMYAEVGESVVHEAEKRGYTVMMAVTMRDAKTELELVNTIIDHSAAGILMSPSDPAAQACNTVVKEGVPYVEMLNRGLPSECNIFEADNCNGAREAVEHLIKLGHRSIAHIGGLQNSTGTARREGYELALQKAGISCLPGLFENGEYTRKGGQAACERLLSSGEPFSAIFCASDLMAYGAMETLALKGLRIPDDVSLIGFDDMSMSSLPGIDLSSVSFNPAQLAKNAIEQLIRIIENPAGEIEPVHEVARCTLMVRGSVSVPASLDCS
ncbi:LacI family DNA-binding transcriptional regulator [Granulosicoccus antarcticus]|uniref:Putative HTH-type transcriptional repressor ExuR n=1 Tax=Granulosicoccus antarcticus IMCC3135 TaxID=1192854 RepID=A0A2Z2NS55_9GAMM|nr:LacI family DNA-binding transcriptional regulator [Granulosicoccus antarcticus]ASJ71570.1 putative HTH-type transcriptional repressor ExuR [Granulosicoccus antarcticus IMCC3135]